MELIGPRGDGSLTAMTRSRTVQLTAVLIVLSAAGLAASGLTLGGDESSARPAEAPIHGGDQRTLAQAQDILIRRCVRRHGLSLPAAPARSANGAESAREFPYGIPDVSWARRHGFGDADRREAREQSRARQPRSARSSGTSSAAAQRALNEAVHGPGNARQVSVVLSNGITVSASAEGCNAWAQRYLYGDLGRWFRASVITSNIRSEALPHVFRAAPFRDALRRWSRCMRAAGHRATSPIALRDRFARRAATLKSRRAARLQRELATAEARCVVRTRLAAIGRDLERRAMERQRRLRRNEIRALRVMEARALPRARRVVAGRGGRTGS
jgi:hypothetical protein